jgi:hypothetical protein
MLNLYWSPNKPILREAHLKYFGNCDELNARKQTNLINILSTFTQSITLAPYLQLPYLLRAKTFVELENFESALKDAKSMAITNSVNLRGSVIEKIVAWRKKEKIYVLATLAIVVESGNIITDEVISTPSDLESLGSEITNAEKQDNSKSERQLKNSNPKLAYSIIQTQKILIDRLRKGNVSLTDLISAHDIKCQLCFELLNDPVNCPCGHVWCRSCLLTLLKSSNQCPMCRSKLPQMGYFILRPSCKFIEKIVGLFKPKLSFESEIITTPLFISSIGFPGSRLSFRIVDKGDRVILQLISRL